MDVIDNFKRVYDQARELDPEVFLVLSKSDNKNIVVYKTSLEDNNFTNKSVSGYWQTWEEVSDGKPQIDKLSAVEKKLAFGVKRISVESAKYVFSLNGYSKIPISVFRDTNGEMTTRMTFSDQEYRILGMYVHVNPAKTCSKPKGVSLMVQLPLPCDDGIEWSPLFSIYLDAKVAID